jgi:hypothetical protein
LVSTALIGLRTKLFTAYSPSAVKSNERVPIKRTEFKAKRIANVVKENQAGSCSCPKGLAKEGQAGSCYCRKGLNAEEKLHIAHFYADYKDLLEGKLEGASKTGESKREKAFEQLAGELTAMGYGVRTVKRVKIKLKAMKARASKKVSKEVGNTFLYFNCLIR